MDFVHECSIAYTGSHTRPRVIGKVGTLMATNDINIASWHTGRATPGGHTLTVLTLDEPLPDDIYATLCAQEFVRHAHQVKIG